MPEELSDRTMCFRCGQTEIKNLFKCNQCNSITYCDKVCQREDWGRHKDNCIPVMLTELKGKGRGLVASRNIRVGEVIFTEEAAVTWSWNPLNVGSISGWPRFQNNAFKNFSKAISKQVQSMSKEEQSQFYNLRGCNSEPAFPFTEIAIFLANRIQEDESYHLFLNLSLINHSCAPNSAWSYKATESSAFKKEYTELAHYLCLGMAVYALLSDWSLFWQILSYIMILFLNVPVMYLCSGAVVCLMREDWCFIWKILSFFLINYTYSKLECPPEPKGKLVLRAIKNIQEGEEINLCYLGYDENLGSKHQMKQHLETDFKFDCKCSVCIGGKYLGSLRI